MRWELVLIGMGTGLAFAVPPGVVTAETLRRGLRGGLGHALAVQFGSLIGDATYALVALAGLAALFQSRLAQTALGVCGAAFILYLAWGAVTARLEPEESKPANTPTHAGSFLAGMLLSLTNPMAIAFWLSLGSSFLALGLRGAADLGAVFGSFMLGVLLWTAVLAVLIERGRRWLSPRLFRGLSIACAVALAAFALGIGARVISSLFV